MRNEDILTVEKLSYSYDLGHGIKVPALNDISLTIKQGEIFSLVGESGSGKSTLAKCIMNMITPDKGEIHYDGIKLAHKGMSKRDKKRIQKEVQFIFQDSSSALNPRMTVEQIIAEPLKINKMYSKEHMSKHMSSVKLDESYYLRSPAELSGGQRQRVSIARAVAMEPRLLVADEPVAALDVSIQAQIMNLFSHLQEDHGFSFLLISHDLAMMEFISDRIGVMYQGRLVEMGPTKEIFANPVHPYTKALLASIPIPDPRLERTREVPKIPELKFSGNEMMEEVTPGHFVLGGGA